MERAERLSQISPAELTRRSIQILELALIEATERTPEQTKRLTLIRELRSKLPPDQKPPLQPALEILFSF